MSNTKFLNAAKRFDKLGLLPLPTDGKFKRPIIGGWDKLDSMDEIPQQLWVQATAISILMKPSSLETIDIDTKHNKGTDLVSPILAALRAGFDRFDELLMQRTPSGGIHLVYRSEFVQGSKKLAKDEDGVVIIETRGTGALILVEPSPNYELLGGDWANIPELDEDEREDLLAICATFNKYVPKITITKREVSAIYNKESKSFEDYNNNCDMIKLLGTFGWTHVGENEKGKLVLRDGETNSKYSGVVFNDSNKLFVHSTSTKFENQHSYSAIDVEIILSGRQEYAVIGLILNRLGIEQQFKDMVVTGEIDDHHFKPLLFQLREGEKRIPLSPLGINDKVFEHAKMKFRYNELSGNVEVLNSVNEAWNPFTTRDLNQLYMSISDKYKVTIADLGAAINNPLVSKSHNPIKEFWGQLPEWDGIDRVVYLIDALNVLQPEDKANGIISRKGIAELYMRRWLRGLVACSTKENEINEIVLTLIGKQGYGKDRFIQALLPPVMQGYFATTPLNGSDRDVNTYLTQSLIINISEGDVVLNSKRSVEYLKGLISTPKVNQRKLYSDTMSIVPRIASFTMTANDPEVLSDATGNRRIAPIEVGKIDYEHDIDMNQVYAQVIKQEDKWWFSHKEIEQMENLSEEFEQESVELGYLRQYYEVLSESDNRFFENMYNVTEVHLALSQLVHNISKRRLTQALIKFTGGRSRKNNGRRGYYIFKKIL